MKYEYGIGRTDTPLDDENVNPHRRGMTEEEATKWVREWEEEIFPNARPGIFKVIKRLIGEWEYDN